MQPAATLPGLAASPSRDRRLGAVATGLAGSLPVAALVVVYVAHFSAVSVGTHQGWGSGAFDLGIFDQGLWLLSRFHSPFVTLNGRNLFADHASFILLPLVPLYWVWPRAEALLAAQSLAIAGAAVPIYLLAWRRLESRLLATGLAAAFLLHPALQLGTLDEFHPEAFLVLFAALAVYAAVTDQRRLLIVSAALCLLAKEDAVLVVVPLAAWVMLRRDRALGRLLVAGALAYVVAVAGVIMPMLGGGPLLLYSGRTFPFGGFRQTLSTLVHKPGDLFDHLRGDQRPFYAWQMLFPSALVGLRVPGLWAVGLPFLGLNVLSAFPYQHQIRYHYSLVLVPVFMLAGVEGVAALSRRWRAWATAAVVVAALWSNVLWGVFPFGDHPVVYRSPRHAAVADYRAVAAAIPAGAVVSAHYNFAPHLAHRSQIYMWPNPFRASYWGRFDREGQRLPRSADVEYVMLKPDLSDEDQETWDAIKDGYRLVSARPAVSLFRRR